MLFAPYLRFFCRTVFVSLIISSHSRIHYGSIDSIKCKPFGNEFQQCILISLSAHTSRKMNMFRDNTNSNFFVWMLSFRWISCLLLAFDSFSVLSFFYAVFPCKFFRVLSRFHEHCRYSKRFERWKYTFFRMNALFLSIDAILFQ